MAKDEQEKYLVNTQFRNSNYSQLNLMYKPDDIHAHRHQHIDNTTCSYIYYKYFICNTGKMVGQIWNAPIRWYHDSENGPA